MGRLSVSRASERATMARAGAAMFGAGGLLALAAVAVPHWAGSHDGPAAEVAVGAVAVAILLVAAEDRFQPWLVHPLLVVGDFMIAVGAHFIGRGAATVTAASFYFWIAIYAFYFLSWSEAAVHVAAIAVVYGGLLAIQHDPAGPAQWIVAVGTAAVGGTVVGVLVRQVRAIAGTDPLTGLPNRRVFNDTLAREMARAKRAAQPLSVAVIDLDGLKALNDREGHRAGDRLLKHVAAAWPEALRRGDLLARQGGDEFALVFVNCSVDEAAEVIKRVRASSAATSFSAGVATWDTVEDAEALVERADIALYRAKMTGGGRTVVAGARARIED